MFCTVLCVAFIALSAEADNDINELKRSVNKFYKVSMVASEKNPGQPALFEHADSPVWDSELKGLLFVDTIKQDVNFLEYQTGKITTKHIGYGPVLIVSTVENSKRVLVGVRSSIYLMDWDVENDDALRLIATVDFGMPDNVVNSGKTDSKGRFWMGTRGMKLGDVALDRGTLYSMSQQDQFEPQVQVRPVSISSGIAWALNNTVMYYTDSFTQRVDAFDFDPDTGMLSARRIIIDVTAYGYDEAQPAGMTIDANGNLWIALMFGGTVLHVDPDTRHVIYGYKLPVSRTTAVTWGGPNRDELFVTTSRRLIDTAQEPLAGAIFTIRDTGSVGLPHYHFKIDNPDNY